MPAGICLGLQLPGGKHRTKQTETALSREADQIGNQALTVPPCHRVRPTERAALPCRNFTKRGRRQGSARLV